MSSTSRPTASEIRAPVEYSSSSSARLRSVSGPSDGLSPPAPASRASTWSRLRLLGSRRPGVGGLTACATSNSARPSAAAKRCSPRTAISVRAADTADSGATPVSGSPRRSAIRNSLTSSSVTLARSSMPRVGQVLGVAAQVPAVGAQRVGRHAALDRQVIEVSLQLAFQRRRQRRHGTPCTGCLPCPERRGPVDPRRIHRSRLGDTLADRVCRQNPAHRKGIDDLAAEDPLHGLGERIPLRPSCRLLRRAPRAVRPRSIRWPGRSAPTRR